MAYNRPVRSDNDVYTIMEFNENCECGGFIDYDGFGYPVKEGKADPTISVYPSTRHKVIPKDATHVMWFNR